MSLTDALDEMVNSGVLSPSIAMKVLFEFDRCVTRVLQASKTKASIKGQLHTYRFCGNVWTFIVEDAVVNVTDTDSTSRESRVKLLKVVACDGKLGANTDSV
ncbi:Transcription factor IIA, helical [Ostreococcus tauri]|jgi:transcription initiation factor TFIIA small subunit|uniref:Transcription initiation factor IIA subunit 2 n=1 Tax=Ostreococcus tauri TaxID=70448 RepID=A0A090M724_OSTTA|nr:Transcription factor IIA, helical [Ostreococcus tauri]CEG00902.1 Transcription factor IIA, helical [Ostreococcus tauri]|eukprot:XP_003074736.2 Transcription factor IIA, helical [Ostreococcus tauri]